MDSSRPSTSYTVSHSLPPITALTNELPPPEPSPGFLRDSGNWSISQSKRMLLSTLPALRHELQYPQSSVAVNTIVFTSDFSIVNIAFLPPPSLPSPLLTNITQTHLVSLTLEACKYKPS
jgi:hypothetical protein